MQCQTHVAREVACSRTLSVCCSMCRGGVDSQRTSLRYTNSYVKHSGARKSYTLLRCYLKSECFAQDAAADYRRKEGSRPLSGFDLQRIICIPTGVSIYPTGFISVSVGYITETPTVQQQHKLHPPKWQYT